MKKNTIFILGTGLLISWISDYVQSEFNSIGKLEDLEQPKGGRVDKYWRNRLVINPSDIVGRNINRSQINMKFPISPDKLIPKFGLKGIEFGNWMNQQDRIRYLTGISISLNDLARCLKVPFKNIGGNALSIASGARGSGGAMAHFEGGGYNVINLTKTTGSEGVLAHEYGHFIDRMLLWPSGHRSVRMKPISLDNYDQRDVRLHMERVIRWLYYDKDMKPTKYFAWQKKATEYYRYRSEVWARCFEVYIMIRLEELGIKNKFLMQGQDRMDLPSKKLVQRARPYIEKVIKAGIN